jgi:4-amino-4-deoxy-L-arabinose transferase-like glycosyltransferase
LFVRLHPHSRNLPDVNQPSPAIVSQTAVKRLPRLALLLFCLAYVLPGFLGRMPWKRDDLSSFGYMAELARGATEWFAPTLGGLPPEIDALLPYWLGGLAIRWMPAGFPIDLAARLPFMLLLLLAMTATWYGTYYLARSPKAQPVSFAFGGEAQPVDYARAIADGALLAFIACLGLAQLAHETTPALAQLGFAALLFFATAALPYRFWTAIVSAGLALAGLTLSGAPFLSLAMGLGGASVYLLAPIVEGQESAQKKTGAWGLVLLSLCAAALGISLGLWRWRIDLPQATLDSWQSLGRLFLWFTWPTWPLALWTLWRWRLQIFNLQFSGLHLWLPICFVMVASAATLTTAAADRSLLLALPALAALAAFALPTLSRSVSALIDWFSLIFFTGCALIIWVVWLSLQTGIPAQPAVNVARLYPGMVHSFSFATLVIATIASMAWAWLVFWRVGRHRAAIWKSVVLPAGGWALCWLLLLTLWLPIVDFARSNAPLVSQAQSVIPKDAACVASARLSRSQIAALRFHGGWAVEPLTSSGSRCEWLITDLAGTDAIPPKLAASASWQWRATIGHPAERQDSLMVYQRHPATSALAPAGAEK